MMNCVNVMLILWLATRVQTQDPPPCTADEKHQEEMASASKSTKTWKLNTWPDKTIPYSISGGFTGNERSIILQSIDTIEAASCVNFIPRTNQRTYVSIGNGESGCYSYVGYFDIGMRELNLESGCVTTGTVIHELLHALGTFHEHTRADRDEYVQVQWDNIKQSSISNFYKSREYGSSGSRPELCRHVTNGDYTNCYSGDDTRTFGLDYDLDSIMHYDSYYFSENRRDTLVALNGQGSMGGDVLTQLDKAKLNAAYSCTVAPPVRTTTTTTTTTTTRPTDSDIYQLTAGQRCKTIGTNKLIPSGTTTLKFQHSKTFGCQSMVLAFKGKFRLRDKRGCPKRYISISEGSRQLLKYCSKKKAPGNVAMFNGPAVFTLVSKYNKYTKGKFGLEICCS